MQTRFRGFQLFFENEQATESMVRAIDDFPSFFTPSGDQPLIVDCGANIGVSVLEWKSRWPMCRVICFEPDPNAFALLRMNMQRNDIPGVQCVASAVNDYDGSCQLYGEAGKQADSRGNSIRPHWGHRLGTNAVEVPCQRLSPLLKDQPVAFLKLDIEGAEEAVLREAAEQLHQVESMYVEVHETDELADTNSLDRIVRLVQAAGMEVEQECRYRPHALPARLQKWQQQVNARQTQLLCWRDEK